jgi:NTE family protein
VALSDREFIQELIEAKTIRLQTLEIEKGRKGEDAPLIVSQELRELRVELIELQARLARCSPEDPSPAQQQSKHSSAEIPELRREQELERARPIENSQGQPPIIERAQFQPLSSRSSGTTTQSTSKENIDRKQESVGMLAFAVLDGGGVKGAALVGCLTAATERHVEWLGFGGSSAGAIVALLASIGYQPHELRRIIIDELAFTALLDDGDGGQLQSVSNVARRAAMIARHQHFCPPLRNVIGLISQSRAVLSPLNQSLGIYSGDRFRKFLFDKIVNKYPGLSDKNDISFADLERNGAKPLKVVASDVTTRRALVFPDISGPQYSVIDAVRASMSYPLVFRPVVFGSRRLVDGGLCTNLPVFLFEDERVRYRVPVIAMDLVEATTGPRPMDGYGLKEFVADLIDTAMEGSQQLLSQQIKGLHHIRVPVALVSALDFDISVPDRQRLFDAGYLAFNKYFSTYLSVPASARDRVEQIQAAYEASPRLVRPLLESVANQVERVTTAKDVRVHVMLPTLQRTRIVVYQFGMDDDEDAALELNESAGCSGLAFSYGQPVFADLEEAARDPLAWGMTKEQHNRVPRDRKAMVSVPIFKPQIAALEAGDERKASLHVMGTLSVDTTTALADTYWIKDLPERVRVVNADLVKVLATWAEGIGRLLS